MACVPDVSFDTTMPSKRDVLQLIYRDELVHLVHPDHTPAFWTRLGRVMPDYKGRRDRLRNVGTGHEL